MYTKAQWQWAGAGWLLAWCVLLALLAGLRVSLPAPAAVHASSFADAPITGLNALNDGPTLRGSATHFSATVTGGDNISYTWDFGDGTAGSGTNPAHVYTVSGLYTATVTAANDAGSHQATTAAQVGDALVDVLGLSFAPSEVTITAGERVIWVLRSGVHSVTADDGSFEQPLGSAWPPFMHHFAAAGEYPYYCSLHGDPGGVGMSGRVRVLPPEEFKAIFLPIVQRRSSRDHSWVTSELAQP